MAYYSYTHIISQVLSGGFVVDLCSQVLGFAVSDRTCSIPKYWWSLGATQNTAVAAWQCFCKCPVSPTQRLPGLLSALRVIGPPKIPRIRSPPNAAKMARSPVLSFLLFGVLALLGKRSMETFVGITSAQPNRAPQVARMAEGEEEEEPEYVAAPGDRLKLKVRQFLFFFSEEVF